MIAVAVFLAIGVACGIGAVFVLREAGRQAAQPTPPTYSLDEAYAWVVANVPPLVAQTLRPDDVRTILAYQLEFFLRQGVTQGDTAPNLAADTVIGETETVGYIVSRAAADGVELLPEQVYPVVESQLAYLQAIGAVGPRRTA